MTSLTATTSMKDWISSGWTITPGYILGLAGPPSLPPGATGDILSGWNPPADALRGEFKLVGAEDYRDHIEDLALAEQMLEEYETQGIEGTIPYSVYRARRLGPGS